MEWVPESLLTLCHWTLQYSETLKLMPFREAAIAMLQQQVELLEAGTVWPGRRGYEGHATGKCA
jgi:hypothetical protein